jgi:[ribosomal protein S18]-alanine N-acetyltransferase
MSEPSTVVLVPMTTEHVTALMPYEQQMFGPEAWSVAAYREEIADVSHRHYLAAVDGEGALLAWGGVRIVGDAAEVLTVGVIRAARRRGIARRLLRALLAAAAARGATEAFLEVRVDNAAARRLYEAEGFARVGIRRGYYDGGRVDAVVMRQELRS